MVGWADWRLTWTNYTKSFPLPLEVSHEMLLFAERFGRRRSLRMVDDDDDGRTPEQGYTYTIRPPCLHFILKLERFRVLKKLLILVRPKSRPCLRITVRAVSYYAL